MEFVIDPVFAAAFKELVETEAKRQFSLSVKRGIARKKKEKEQDQSLINRLEKV